MSTQYKKDLLTGEMQKYQEPQFIPRHPHAAEGDGFLIALVNNFDEMISKLVIIDCNKFEGLCGCHKAVYVSWATCHNCILNLLLLVLFFLSFFKTLGV